MRTSRASMLAVAVMAVAWISAGTAQALEITLGVLHTIRSAARSASRDHQPREVPASGVVTRGSEPATALTRYDLSTDGVGYSTTGGFIDDIVPELEAFKEQIVAGEIVVPTAP